jgi:hypothetical protein
MSSMVDPIAEARLAFAKLVVDESRVDRKGEPWRQELHDPSGDGSNAVHGARGGIQGTDALSDAHERRAEAGSQPRRDQSLVDVIGARPVGDVWAVDRGLSLDGDSQAGGIERHDRSGFGTANVARGIVDAEGAPIGLQQRYRSTGDPHPFGQERESPSRDVGKGQVCNPPIERCNQVDHGVRDANAVIVIAIAHAIRPIG